jgi:hypothetical protein
MVTQLVKKFPIFMELKAPLSSTLYIPTTHQILFIPEYNCIQLHAAMPTHHHQAINVSIYMDGYFNTKTYVTKPHFSK